MAQLESIKQSKDESEDTTVKSEIGHEEDKDQYQSDEDVNENRVGLPAVTNFYEKYKTIDRNIEKSKDQR